MKRPAVAAEALVTTRRTFLKVMAVGLVAARTVNSSVLSAAGAVIPFIPYTADSFFRSSVVGAPVDTVRTASFKTFMATFVNQNAVRYPRISGTGTSPWGAVFHLGRSTDPIWKLTGPGLRPETQIAATRGFHMADAVADQFPTGTQDRTGIIVDPMFGYTVQTGDSAPNKATRTINVASSGVFFHASNGLDKRNPRSTDKRNWCSRGRIPDALVIRRDLVNAAIARGTGLRHVLQMSLCETNAAAGFGHPMVGAETNQFGWGAEGTRIAIRPDVNLVARGLKGAALVVARTLQENGCYIGDNSGSSSTVKAQQASPSHDPWLGTNLSADCLSGRVSWNDFYVLPLGWQR